MEILVGFYLLTLAVLTVGLLIGFIVVGIKSKLSEKEEKKFVEKAIKIKDNKNVFNEVKQFTDEYKDIEDKLNKIEHDKNTFLEIQKYFSGTYSTEEEICEIHKIISSEEFVDAISPWEFEKLEWNNNTKKYFLVISAEV